MYLSLQSKLSFFIINRTEWRNRFWETYLFWKKFWNISFITTFMIKFEYCESKWKTNKYSCVTDSRCTAECCREVELSYVNISCVELLNMFILHKINVIGTLQNEICGLDRTDQFLLFFLTLAKPLALHRWLVILEYKSRLSP